MTNHPTCATCAHYTKPPKFCRNDLRGHVGFCAGIVSRGELQSYDSEKKEYYSKEPFVAFSDSEYGSDSTFHPKPDFYCPLHSELERKKTDLTPD